MKERKREKQSISVSTEKPIQSSSIKLEIIALLVCLPFLLIGFAFIKIGIERISYLKPYTAETKGMISNVTVKKTKKSAGFGYLKTYYADYSYKVDGKTFTDTLKSTNKLKKGKYLKIRYIPDNPKSNYVRWYDTSARIALLIWGIIWDAFFLLIVYCILLSIKHKKLKKNKIDTTAP